MLQVEGGLFLGVVQEGPPRQGTVSTSRPGAAGEEMTNEWVAPLSLVSQLAVSDPSPSASGHSHTSSRLVLFSCSYICHCLISLGSATLAR